MSYVPFTTSFCYASNFDINGYVTWFFYGTPLTAWFLISGLAFYTRDWYIQLLSSSYWITSLVCTLLQELIRDARPNPLCNNQGHGSPAFEVALGYALVVLTTAHQLTWIGAVGTTDIIRDVVLTLVIPTWLVVSGNYTIGQVLLGALVGTLTGLFSVQAIFLFWIDRLRIITTHPIFERWGYRDNIPAFSDNDTSGGRNVLLDAFMTEPPESKLTRTKYPIQRPRRSNNNTQPNRVPHQQQQQQLAAAISDQESLLPQSIAVPGTPAVATTYHANSKAVPVWDRTSDLIAAVLLGGGTLDSPKQ